MWLIYTHLKRKLCVWVKLLEKQQWHLTQSKEVPGLNPRRKTVFLVSCAGLFFNTQFFFFKCPKLAAFGVITVTRLATASEGLCWEQIFFSLWLLITSPSDDDAVLTDRLLKQVKKRWWGLDALERSIKTLTNCQESVQLGTNAWLFFFSPPSMTFGKWLWPIITLTVNHRSGNEDWWKNDESSLMIDSDVFMVQLKVNLTSSRSDRTADLVVTSFSSSNCYC